jgi:hypothetical protein
MNTNDADLDIPEITDFSRFQPGRYVREPGEGLDIRIDGAIGYSVRIIPSNKVVGRFASTFDAWPAVLAEVARGIPARCLVLDWHDSEGRHGAIGSGRLLVSVARSGIGSDADRMQVQAANRRSHLSEPVRRRSAA